MKSFSFIGLAVVLPLSTFFGGGAERVQTRWPNINRSETVMVQPTPLPLPNKDLDGVEPIIEFERTSGACFETCPVYSVAVYPDRRVMFEGKTNVKTTGQKRTTISKTSFNQLVNAFKAANYFDLADNYIDGTNCPERWEDAPSVRIYFKTGGFAKTIYHYQGCKGRRDLEKLSRLEEEIDRLTNTSSWVR
jgi:hypothetical protein